MKLDLVRLATLAAIEARPHRCSAHADMRWGCFECDPVEDAMHEAWEFFPQLVRIAQAAHALDVHCLSYDAHLRDCTTYEALRQALEGGEGS